MSRNIYLRTLPISDALERVRSRLDRDALLSTERIPTHEAVGRITAEPVYAKASSPTYHSAAMDGIAVQAEQTFAAREGRPLELARDRGYIPVNTGEPLPEGCNAVIMIEHVQELDQNTVAIEAPAFPWQHVRRIGEDIVATELLLPQNHRLSPYDIGALLSGGIFEVPVLAKPHIIFIPTGDEVLDFTRRPEPRPGEVIESNSQVLAAMARLWDVRFTRMDPVPDDAEALSRAVEQGLAQKPQALIIGAGSSAGSRDYTRQTMELFGEILVHGIDAMPGKPSLIGLAGETILFGAPGYPVSSVVCFEQLLEPLLAWMQRMEPRRRPQVPVELTRKVPSKLGQEEFLRVSIGKVGAKYVATPLPRGAGLMTSLTKAQGVVRIPADSEGQNTGSSLPAELLVSETALDRILVCVGSHDNTLDLLANELMGLERPLTLSSTHVGSMGGLLALQSSSAHLAGAHLYDPGSRDYNFPFLEKHLPGRQIRVVNLAIRQQGLIVARGNPKSIAGLRDLVREDVRFLNRQRGAGTRILLDDELERSGIDPQQIAGYEQEEYTHMAIAVNVQSGVVDCGMGIYAAAKALGLDFVPLARERYDLLIPEEQAREPSMQTLLNLLRSDTFKEKIAALGGYEVGLTGEVMSPGTGLG